VARDRLLALDRSAFDVLERMVGGRQGQNFFDLLWAGLLKMNIHDSGIIDLSTKFVQASDPGRVQANVVERGEGSIDGFRRGGFVGYARE
jgi:hypothetical protein